MSEQETFPTTENIDVNENDAAKKLKEGNISSEIDQQNGNHVQENGVNGEEVTNGFKDEVIQNGESESAKEEMPEAAAADESKEIQLPTAANDGLPNVEGVEAVREITAAEAQAAVAAVAIPEQPASSAAADAAAQEPPPESPVHDERLVDHLPPDPDQLADADNYYAFKSTDAVKLHVGDSSIENSKPCSIPTLLVNTVRKNANGIALVAKRNGMVQRWTYAQYFDDIKRAARSFIKLGLELYHGVCILGFNSPEWFIADLAAIVAGGLAVGIYTTNSPEACEYVAKDCEANIVVVENDVQLQKMLKIRDGLPHLRAIVQYTGELTEKYSNVYTWKEFMQIGEDVPEEALIERIRGQAPNKCCTLIYTSGTTGAPKGVMLSHDNITWISLSTSLNIKFEYGKEQVVSYLPLSHIAAQIADIYLSIFNGSCVTFARPDALKGTLKDTLKEVRPTFFIGVPRVWEKMAEAIKAKGAQVTGIKRTIGDWAKGIGIKTYRNAQIGEGTPFGYTIANALVFSKVLKETGLDRCQNFTAAAPISKDTLEYLASIGIVVSELYGMSESTGPHTVCVYPNSIVIGSVGKTLPGCKTLIEQPDEEGNGEICMYGRHVFMGYLNQEDKTLEAIDDKGFLHSGDVGKVDEKGFLYITGRIKEILITAGGENVAPVPIEESVKKALPVVSNAMLIGDRKKFLSCLLTLKTVVNLDTAEPTDELTPEALAWCKSIGSEATHLSHILDTNDKEIMAAIQAGIDKANAQSVSRAQKIQKWTVLPKDFSIPGGELGPTLKLRRPIVMKMYEKTINNFYEES